MQHLKSALLSRQVWLVFVVSLCLNTIFLIFLYDDSFYSGIARASDRIAFNIWKNTSVKPKPQQNFQSGEIDYYCKGIGETVGYGIVLGLLWKLTSSNSPIDIQILQIILFSLSLFLVYAIALIFFKNKQTALLSCIALLGFFPVIYLNVHTLRDIWIYYGLIAITYVLASYFFSNGTLWGVVIGGTFFSWCQFIRPPLFVSLIVYMFILFCCFLFKLINRRKTIATLCVLTFINGVCFWLPFMWQNKAIHGRFFVSRMGQNLLEGLGEFSNPWGLKLSDENFCYYMEKNFSLEYGSIECDDKAKSVFISLVKENPVFYVMNVIKRLHRLFLPGLPWFKYVEGMDFKEKIKNLFSIHVLLDFIGRQIYIRLYLLIGYFGIVLLLIRRRFLPVLFIFGGCIISSWWLIFLHIEHRYLIPYYAFFAFFVGYALYELFKFIQNYRIRKKKEKKTCVA